MGEVAASSETFVHMQILRRGENISLKNLWPGVVVIRTAAPTQWN
jgi:hypothetical protein